MIKMLESNQEGVTWDDWIWRETQYVVKAFRFDHIKNDYECLDTRKDVDSLASREGKPHLLSRVKRVFPKALSLELKIFFLELL